MQFVSRRPQNPITCIFCPTKEKIVSVKMEDNTEKSLLKKVKLTAFIDW